MEFSCTCGMCPDPPIDGAIHDTAPEKFIPQNELCQWHREHGNEGLHYIELSKLKGPGPAAIRSYFFAAVGAMAAGIGGINLPDFFGDMRFERRFPDPLPQETVNNMCQRDFVDYFRNQLWDHYAQKEYKKPFDELTYPEKMGVDMDVMLDYMKALEQIRNEDAKAE